MIIDSHTHIYDEAFDADREEMIQRALSVGVTQMVLPNINKDSLGDMLKLCLRYPQYLFPTIGLHPTDVDGNWKEVLQYLKEHFYLYQYVAIGEIGLDYYWSIDYKTEQIECFRSQLRWAAEMHLPVIIHTRESFDDTFSIVREVKAEFPHLSGVFHSFTGSLTHLEEALDIANFLIGINGVVTFKNSDLKSFISKVPLDRLLIETDAPYLAPVPKRGKRNEPAFIIYTAEFIATLYGISLTAFTEATGLNAKRLFSLP